MLRLVQPTDLEFRSLVALVHTIPGVEITVDCPTGATPTVARRSDAEIHPCALRQLVAAQYATASGRYAHDHVAAATITGLEPTPHGTLERWGMHGPEHWFTTCTPLGEVIDDARQLIDTSRHDIELHAQRDDLLEITVVGLRTTRGDLHDEIGYLTGELRMAGLVDELLATVTNSGSQGSAQR
jgi:hypothetical protein